MENKKVENMTTAEIKALKRQYKNEFRDILEKFFEERPLIDYICFHHVSGLSAVYDSWIFFNPDRDDIITGIHLYGEKKK